MCLAVLVGPGPAVVRGPVAKPATATSSAGTLNGSAFHNNSPRSDGHFAGHPFHLLLQIGLSCSENRTGTQNLFCVHKLSNRLRTMHINRVLWELRAERERVKEAIIALERLAETRGLLPKGRPKWMEEMTPRSTIHSQDAPKKDPG